MKRKNLVAGALACAMATTGAYARAQRSSTPAPPADAPTFVNEMAIAGMAEVQLGKLASDHGQSADVKQFGQMMVKDHTQANAELERAAKQLNITLPTQLDQKHRDLVDRLSKLTGAAFDREYMNAMVPGHEEVAAKLRAKTGTQATTSNTPSSQSVGTSGATGDQALTQWAAKSLPTVQHHLERAKEVQQKTR